MLPWGLKTVIASNMYTWNTFQTKFIEAIKKVWRRNIQAKYCYTLRLCILLHTIHAWENFASYLDSEKCQTFNRWCHLAALSIDMAFYYDYDNIWNLCDVSLVRHHYC